MLLADAAALRHLDVETLLLPVLVQLIVILLAARLFAVLFRKIGQPAVVGEIAAGLILGPSVFGALFPEAARAIFQPTLGGLSPELSDALLTKIFNVLSQLGLIFLLFLVGLEFDFSHLRWHGRSAVAISVAGVALPFALGVALAGWMVEHIEPHPARPGPVPTLGFTLFLGVAMSITAIPVLARIMMELGITRTRVGTVTIAAAAVDDASGWVLLAAIAATVNAQFEIGRSLLMIGGTVLFTLGMVFIVRPLLLRGLAALRRDGQLALGPNALALLLALLFACSILTNLIGIFAVFGAFLLGAILSDQTDLRDAVAAGLRGLVTVFFLPIFFAYTGLRTDVGTLNSASLWLFCGLVLLVAIIGKFAGCGLAAWLSGQPWREAACIGA
ncbi:MAG: cation:proton antiporter, partial [Planctomycetia bacterium]|nr:cation:proton antiporter [Planctomycetia bacterium]